MDYITIPARSKGCGKDFKVSSICIQRNARSYDVAITLEPMPKKFELFQLAGIRVATNTQEAISKIVQDICSIYCPKSEMKVAIPEKLGEYAWNEVSRE